MKLNPQNERKNGFTMDVLRYVQPEVLLFWSYKAKFQKFPDHEKYISLKLPTF